MTTTDLRERGLDYLSCGNDRRLDELDNHVHDVIVVNDLPVALGIPVTGASFAIAEWAMYHYRDGKIAGMHFLLDVAAAHEQLS